MTLPTNEKEYYSWEIQTTKLKLVGKVENGKENYFKDSEFELEISQKEEFTELVILNNNEFGYKLRK